MQVEVQHTLQAGSCYTSRPSSQHTLHPTHPTRPDPLQLHKHAKGCKARAHLHHGPVALVEAVHAGVSLAGRPAADEVHLAGQRQRLQLVCRQLPALFLGLQPDSGFRVKGGWGLLFVCLLVRLHGQGETGRQDPRHLQKSNPLIRSTGRTPKGAYKNREFVWCQGWGSSGRRADDGLCRWVGLLWGARAGCTGWWHGAATVCNGMAWSQPAGSQRLKPTQQRVGQA